MDNANQFKGKLVNSYDYDGNLQVLKRYNQDNNLADNFNYRYYSQTIRLQNLSSRHYFLLCQMLII